MNGSTDGWATDPRRAAAFRDISALVTGPDTWEQAVERAAVALGDALDSVCLIGVLDGEAQQLHPIGLHHPDPGPRQALQELLAVPFPPGDGFISRMLTSERPEIASLSPDDLAGGSGHFSDFAREFDLNSVAGAPIDARSGRIGVVVLSRSEGGFAEADAQFLGELAALLGLAIESAFLMEALKQAAGRRETRVRFVPRTAAPEDDRRSFSNAAALSDKEGAVLAELARGHTNKEVADRLGVSVRTVEWHRARIQWKLGVTTRAELIAAAANYTAAPDDAGDR